VLDPWGADVLSAALPLVRPGGRVVTLAPREADPNDPSGVTITPLFVHPDGPGLGALAAAVVAGGLRTQLGQTFPVDRVVSAHRAYEQGASGKVVVTTS
jgi:NADPH:quinone reductase-like Zn-dependent oxidoreductase